MTIQDYLSALRRHWLVILGGAVLGFALAAGLSLAATPQYTASSKLYFTMPDSGSSAQITSGSSYAMSQMPSYAALATQPVLLKKVIAEEGLDTTPKQLAGQVTATVEKDTVLLDLSVTDPDPQQAAAIANSVSKHLRQQTKDLAPTTENGTTLVAAAQVADAEPPKHASSPNTRRNAAAGLLAGLFVAVAWVLARRGLDSRVRDADAVAEVSAVPVLGQVRRNSPANAHARMMYATPDRPEAEDFRRLRSAVKHSAPDGRGTVLTVSSPRAGGGATTTVLNLGIAAAETGMRVLLVDADLHTPDLAAYTGVPDTRGLTDLVAGTVGPAEAVKPLIPGSVDVLTHGTRDALPGQVLDSPAMDLLLTELRTRYDLVVVDTPATRTASDAATLAPKTDGLVLVVDVPTSRRRDLRQALDAMQRLKVTVLGVVLNRAEEASERAATGRRKAPAVQPLLEADSSSTTESGR